MEYEKREDQEIFSKAVKAGKRTYFFDVKSTRENDFYVVVTESKRQVDRDGKFTYKKHKVFLYKEDFIKFTQGLQEVIDYVRENSKEEIIERTHVDFNDLGQ